MLLGSLPISSPGAPFYLDWDGGSQYLNFDRHDSAVGVCDVPPGGMADIESSFFLL